MCFRIAFGKNEVPVKKIVLATGKTTEAERPKKVEEKGRTRHNL